MKLLFFDNYDSFTFNLVHYLKEVGATVEIVDQEMASSLNLDTMNMDAVLIGPGPKTPSESGVLLPFLRNCMDREIPILGVCLGHQALGEVLGMQLNKAKFPVHGKSSILNHTENDIFQGLSNPMEVGRYHSLIVENTSESTSEIKVLMEDEIGQIMAFRHVNRPFWGIQFHPESVLTPDGKQLLKNWIGIIDSD